MKKYKNKLVIIGNGFDLAHGLKTSYNDFITWYLNSVISKIDFDAYESIYDDFLIKYTYKVQDNQDIPNFYEVDKIKWFFDKIRFSLSISLDKISPFLKKLIDNFEINSWIDVESEYYNELKTIYLNGNSYLKNGVSEVKELNADFEFIKKKLEEYLTTIDCRGIGTKQEINNLFQSDYCVGYNRDVENYKSIHYLNFNYTETIKKYIWPQSNYELNFIHGELRSIINPIIFGYGDEIDKYYEEIQNLNINEFLNNFKSFGYFKTENYSNLLRFIESEPFDVEILGHSCGLSDRVLLNTIFEHDNCESIRIHYYQKSETENDFLSKTQEISRHFKDKAKMRKRIVNFKDCKPLVKFRK